MFGSAVVYAGLLVTLAGALRLLRPNRRRALPILGAGMALTGIGLLLPAPESRVTTPRSQLDAVMPVWQFHERHTIHIDAPPARVFAAVEEVRADEIALFHTLTAIRRGGRQQPENILNAGNRRPLLDVATRSGFVRLAYDPPRELVIGAVVVRPPGGARAIPTPDTFRHPLPPGYAIATMNFAVHPEGTGSLVTTETRVFANNPAARRRFAAYWRTIYPGSALIRRMWLRAIEKRAMG
jgi:hypothetical protein